jgi:hypothetical protein
MMWTREDDVHNGRPQSMMAHYLHAGLDASGKMIARHQRLAGDRVLPLSDPERYELSGNKDILLMLMSRHVRRMHETLHRLAIEALHEAWPCISSEFDKRFRGNPDSDR